MFSVQEDPVLVENSLTLCKINALSNKKQIDKDDVWNKKFNKPKNSEIVKKNKKPLQKFCDKLWQKCQNYNFNSQGKLSNSFGKNISSISENMKNNLKDIDNNYADKNNEIGDTIFINNENSKSINFFNENTEIDDILNINEKPKSISFNIEDSFKINKDINNVNILLTVDDLKKTKRISHFEKNVKADWLERCTTNTPNPEPLDSIDNNFLKNLYHQDNNLRKKSHVKKSYDSNIDLINQQENGDSNAIKRSNQKVNNNDSNLNTSFKLKEVNSKHKASVKPDIYEFNETLIEQNVNHVAEDNLSNDELNFEVTNSQKTCRKRIRKTPSKSNKFSKKQESLNENFVKINIKKKTFSRGHHPVNIKKLKWNKWKNLQKESRKNKSNNCFNCGEEGHWARDCTRLKEFKSSTEKLVNSNTNS